MNNTQPKKRGRPRKNKQTKQTTKKSKQIDKSKKYSLLDNVSTINQKIIDSVVVHLPIDINKFKKQDLFLDNEFLNYDPKIFDPLPYDPKSSNNNIYEHIDNKTKEDKKEIKNKNEYNLHKKDKYINKKVKDILVQFDDFNKIQQWPFSIDIKCWWCCHNFENTPCGIPIKLENNTFYVYGCFCSFNCALTYNFNTNDDKKWERAGLINLLYNKTYNISDDIETELNYAPNRECLKDFGGYLTIEKFRIQNNTAYNLKLSTNVINYSSNGRNKNH